MPLIAIVALSAALAGTDARVSIVAPDDRGPGASRSSILYSAGAWHRYEADADGIAVQTSTDGLTWSNASVALAGNVAEPSVIAVGPSGYSWLMAYSSGGQVDLAGSNDGLTFTPIDGDHPACTGDCGAPALLHVGQYFILNHTEHTADFDGMRVHHSTDGLAWSSGLTHTLPDGSDSPDIVYTPQTPDQQWRLVSRSATGDVVRIWQADKIEGDKTEVGAVAGSGLPAFYRTDAGSAPGDGLGTIWFADGDDVVRTAIADADGPETPPDASCATAGIVAGTTPDPVDGPETDGSFHWDLPGNDVCTIVFPLPAGTDFSAATALEAVWDGPASIVTDLLLADGRDLSLGSATESGSKIVPAGSGVGVRVSVIATTKDAATFRLYTLTATGAKVWGGFDTGADSGGGDSAVIGQARTCGCVNAPVPGGYLLAGFGLLLVLRRRSGK